MLSGEEVNCVSKKKTVEYCIVGAYKTQMTKVQLHGNVKAVTDLCQFQGSVVHFKCLMKHAFQSRSNGASLSEK